MKSIKDTYLKPIYNFETGAGFNCPSCKKHLDTVHDGKNQCPFCGQAIYIDLDYYDGVPEWTTWNMLNDY